MASKRKLIVAREPNGRAQRERESAPTAMKRLRDAALREARHAEWGTELGRLFLSDEITEEQYAAGKWWTEQAKKYQSAIGAFPVRSATLEVGRGGAAPDPDSPEGQKIAKREANQAEVFFAAHAALVQSGYESVVRRLCENDEFPCGWGELMAAKRGLSALATHRGLTNQRKNNVISAR